MLDSLLSPTTVPLLEQSAAFSERRHEVLAGNIANIDTPHYRRKDLPLGDFQAALEKAIDSRSERGMRLARYAQPDRDPSEFFADALREVRTAARTNPTFQDGGERSIEADVLALTKNLMTQSMNVELMSAQLNLLGAVISEQP